MDLPPCSQITDFDLPLSCGNNPAPKTKFLLGGTEGWGIIGNHAFEIYNPANNIKKMIRKYNKTKLTP